MKLLERLKEDPNEMDIEELKIYFFQEFWLSYEAQLDIFSIFGEGLDIFRSFEKQIALSGYNLMWQDHLEKTSLLRDAVQWRSYGQKNPLTEYNREVSIMFQKQQEIFVYLTIFIILNVSIV